MNQWHNAVRMKKRGYSVVVLGLEGSELQLACRESLVDFVTITAHGKHYDFRAAWKLSRLVKQLNITDLIIRDGRDMGVATMTKTLGLRKLKVHYFMEMQLGTVKKKSGTNTAFPAA